MQKQLAELQAQVSGPAETTSKPASSQDLFPSNTNQTSKTCTAAKSAAKPKHTQKAATPASNDSDDDSTGPKARPPPKTQAAKEARLRRICERKPTGKIQVAEEIHEKWRTGNKQQREQMLDVLEEAAWDKDIPHIGTCQCWTYWSWYVWYVSLCHVCWFC